jgi:thiol:disulfide interchange protein DsbD
VPDARGCEEEEVTFGRAAQGLALTLLGACASPAEPRDPRAVDDIAFFGIGSVESPRADARAAPPSVRELRWVQDLTTAQVAARVERRKMLVWFHANWSAASLVLEREVWTRPEVREAARPLVPLRLDVSASRPENDGLMAIFSVDSVPAVLVLDYTGRELGRVQGVLEAASILALLRSLEGGRAPRR